MLVTNTSTTFPSTADVLCRRAAPLLGHLDVHEHDVEPARIGGDGRAVLEGLHLQGAAALGRHTVPTKPQSWARMFGVVFHEMAMRMAFLLYVFTFSRARKLRRPAHFSLYIIKEPGDKIKP